MWSISWGWESVPWCQPASVPQCSEPLLTCLAMLGASFNAQSPAQGYSCSAWSVLQCSKSRTGMSCSAVTCSWGFPPSGRGAAHAHHRNGLRRPLRSPCGNSRRVYSFCPAQRGTGSSGIALLSQRDEPSDGHSFPQGMPFWGRGGGFGYPC